MCGRFALTHKTKDVEMLMGVFDHEDFPARYNIAPTDPVLMVLAGHPREPGSNLPDKRSMLVRWGLIPAWAKSPKDMPLLINARSETAIEKPAFKAAMRHRRALIPASGFYEWRRENGRTGQPYWVRPRHRGVIAFAGLMETYAEPGGAEIDTGAILTISANEMIRHIHDRMPIVIQPEDFSRWLDCRTQEPRDVIDLMRPADPDFFEFIPVSDRVNKVANMGPDLQDEVVPSERERGPQPAKPKQDPGQLSLF
jgi:putative SOS response-associated peptidase YedK